MGCTTYSSQKKNNHILVYDGDRDKLKEKRFSYEVLLMAPDLISEICAEEFEMEILAEGEKMRVERERA